MANVTPSGNRGVVVAREVIVEKVQALVRKYPDLISFDPDDSKYESLVMRCKTDPGPAHAERDGWEGVVCDWYFGTYTITDEDSGEFVTLPSLALVTTDGRIIRFSNSEPALRAWLNILQQIGVERVKRGLMVRVSLRPSQTAGRHYWQILPA